MNNDCYTKEQKKLFYMMSDCGLSAMSDAYKIQIDNSNVYSELSFDTRLTELLTAYNDALNTARKATLLRQAK